ncbi:MAG TPA: hypothetical protein VH092_08695 [Urbifossiella sp.]|jgi:hypothetical protein|nr:hypothetical protein [Urbifossiella sp.]
MNLRGRLSKVRAALAARGGPERVFLVVWESTALGRPGHRPPGIYQRAGVVEVDHCPSKQSRE